MKMTLKLLLFSKLIEMADKKLNILFYSMDGVGRKFSYFL